MARRPYRASIILSDKKFRYEFELTREQIDKFLDENLNTIIFERRNSTQYAVRITTNEDGIVANHGLTKNGFNELYYKLVYEL